MPFIAPAIGAVIGAIGTAAAAVSSFIGGLGFVGQALVGIGLNVAGSLLQRAFAKKPKESPGGVQFEREYGQTVSRKVACGLVGIAGHDCYINTYGSSNKLAQWLFTLSDYPSDGFSRLAINGKWVTLGAEEDPEKGWPVTSGDFANLIWLKFYDGRQIAADPYLVDNANPSDRWSVDHIGVGITGALISTTYDREENNALPDLFFEFRGARLYDWRKDSTAGGSGAHRWDDPSTHEFSENPILMDYHYRRGFSVNGDLFCGMDMPAGDLPLDKFTAAANICDETDADGQKRYRCSIMLDAGADVTHGDNIESLMLSCGGMGVDGVAGSWPVVGSDQPIVATITDEDLITTAPVEFRAKRSMAELVNSVAGNFPNPDELWSMVGYDPQISEAAIAVDRRTRDLAIDFPQVRWPRQAAQLASIYLKENRYEASGTITARPRFQVLEAGDWIRWNSARYGDRVCMIAENTLASLSSDGPRNARLSLQERDGSIYDGVTPPAIVLPAPPGEPQYLAEVQDFALAAVSVSGSDGRLAPAIRASWSSIEDETVTAVQVRYFPTDQPEAVIYRTVPVDTTVALLVEGVLAETEYTVQTKLITDPLRVTAWSAGEVVTTVEVPSLVNMEDLGEDIKSYQEFTGSQARDVIDQVLRLSTAVAKMTLSGLDRAQQIRREVSVVRDDITSEYQELITTSITEVNGQITVLSAQYEALKVKVDDDIGTTISAVQVQIDELDDEVSGNIDTINAIDLKIDGVSAGATFRMNSYVAPTGWGSRIGAEVRVSTAGAYATASLYLDAKSDGTSRMVVVADQTVVATSDGTISALFDGDTAFFDNSRIRNLNADNIDVETLTGTEGFFQYLVVESGMIAANAVTSSDDSDVTFRQNGNAPAYVDLPGSGITVSSDSGNPVLMYYKMDGTIVAGSFGPTTINLRVRRSDGVVVYGPFQAVTPTDTNAGFSFFELALSAVPGVGTYGYTIQYLLGADSQGYADIHGRLIAQCNRK